eukprot:Em0004g1191a
MAGILRTADALLHCKRRRDGQETSRYLAQRLWSSHISAGSQPGVSRKPADKTFEEIVKLVRDHLTPPSSLGQFVTELRRLSQYCEFGGSLDEMLRDRLVCELRDIRVQCRLFAEPKLTFTKAFELAQAAELAEKRSQDISRAAGASVDALGPRRATAGQMADHPILLVLVAEVGTVLQNVVSGLWSATNAVKRGIWQERAAARNKQLKKQFGNRAGKQSTNLLAEPLEEDEDVEDMYTLFNVRDVSLAPFRVPMEINKASLEMES